MDLLLRFASLQLVHFPLMPDIFFAAVLLAYNALAMY